MKRLVGVCLTGVFVMSLCAFAGAAEQVQRSEVVIATATIEAIDQDHRIVTLRGPQGKNFDVKAGEEVRNFSQLKPGDKVNIKYSQSLLVQVAKPGEQPVPMASRSVERAAPGENPAGTVTEQISTSAKVVDIDKRNSLVTLEGPSGKAVTVKAVDPKNLEKLKVGDQLNITYTQATALSVEKARG